MMNKETTSPPPRRSKRSKGKTNKGFSNLTKVRRTRHKNKHIDDKGTAADRPSVRQEFVGKEGQDTHSGAMEQSLHGNEYRQDTSLEDVQSLRGDMTGTGANVDTSIFIGQPVSNREQPHERRLDTDDFAPSSSPSKSASSVYSFGTPASSWASPIRDVRLTSLPIRPDLDAILRHTVEDMNTTSSRDLADLNRIKALASMAKGLLAQAEVLRSSLRAEKGNRERLEKYVATWRKVPPRWTVHDVYHGEYLVRSGPDGGIGFDTHGRPWEVDIDDLDDDAQFVEPIYPLEPGSQGPFHIRHRQSEPRPEAGSSAGVLLSTRTGLKRRREEIGEAVSEEEGRYQHSFRSRDRSARLAS